MSAVRIAALGLACLFGGVLIGYVLWGQRVQHVLDELGRTQRAHEQLQTELRAAQAQLKTTGDELSFERQRRQGLERLLSEGRK